MRPCSNYFVLDGSIMLILGCGIGGDRSKDFLCSIKCFLFKDSKIKQTTSIVPNDDPTCKTY